MPALLPGLDKGAATQGALAIRANFPIPELRSSILLGLPFVPSGMEVTEEGAGLMGGWRGGHLVSTGSTSAAQEHQLFPTEVRGALPTPAAGWQ